MRSLRSLMQRNGISGLRYFLMSLPLLAFVSISFAEDKNMNASTQSVGVDVTKEVKVQRHRGKEHEYHYSSITKPNPFIPPLISTLMARLELPVESSMQKYSLAEIKLVGIWTLRNTSMRAMMITPNGEGGVMSKGSSIGRRGGKITEIDENSITVREFSLSSDGTRQYEDFKVWIEGTEPKPEEKIIIHSEKAGLPNAFGYGKKNYTNSPTYEERHQDILKRLEEQKYNDIPSDDSRPGFESKEEAPKVGPDATAPKGSVMLPVNGTQASGTQTSGMPTGTQASEVEDASKMLKASQASADGSPAPVQIPPSQQTPAAQISPDRYQEPK